MGQGLDSVSSYMDLPLAVARGWSIDWAAAAWSAGGLMCWCMRLVQQGRAELVGVEARPTAWHSEASPVESPFGLHGQVKGFGVQ